MAVEQHKGFSFPGQLVELSFLHWREGICLSDTPISMQETVKSGGKLVFMFGT